MSDQPQQPERVRVTLRTTATAWPTGNLVGSVLSRDNRGFYLYKVQGAPSIDRVFIPQESIALVEFFNVDE